MGADMLLWTMPLRMGEEPDWTAGAIIVAKLEATPLKDWPEDYRDRYVQGLEEAEAKAEDKAAAASAEAKQRAKEVADLRKALDEVQQAWAGNHREGTSIQVAGYDILVTGGLSWGDPPTELATAIDRLGMSGVEAACGFGMTCDGCGEWPQKAFVLCHGCIEKGVKEGKMKAKLFARRAKGGG
jgi:hypothetical protein